MSRKSPARTLGERIVHAETVSLFTKKVLEKSREALDYDNAMYNYARIIAAVTQNGTLGEKVDAAIALQAQDLRKAMDRDRQEYILQARDAITNFDAALNIFDKLTADPAWYREYAAGFLPKNRRHGLPYDEFLQALASQNSREGNRDTSINTLPGEEALYDARKSLIAAIMREYGTVQESVLAGGDPPSTSGRTRRGQQKPARR